MLPSTVLIDKNHTESLKSIQTLTLILTKTLTLNITLMLNLTPIHDPKD